MRIDDLTKAIEKRYLNSLTEFKNDSNKVKVQFECDDCGYTFEQVFDEDYFEDLDDLEAVMETSENECPECHGTAWATDYEIIENE